MILLALAAQITAPIPIKADAWFTEGDVPASLDLRHRQSGPTRVGYGVMVMPDGVVQNCFVVVSSGNLDVDRHVCGVVIRRAKFQPATDGNGHATYGIHYDTVEWFSGDGEERAAKPSGPLDVTVANLPAKTRSPAEVRVTFAVDPKGLPTSCEPTETDRNALVRAACGQILRAYSAVPARDAAGTPVPSVQSAVVRLFEG